MSKYTEDKLCRTRCPYYAPTGYKVRYKHWCTKYGTYRSWVRKGMAKDGDVCYWMGLFQCLTTEKPEEKYSGKK
jgi:hypothetical protein